MATRYTLDLSDGTFPVKSSEDITAMLTEWNGTMLDGGVAAFSSEEDAEGFAAELKAKEIAKKAGVSRPARGPVNLQALGIIEVAVRESRKAKLAKEYFEDLDGVQVAKSAEIKIVWGAGSEAFKNAAPFIDAAFMEYLPAIMDVARKKAEEADRTCRDTLNSWGPKA